MPANELEQIQQLIRRCQGSPTYFIENFCKIKHPKAGIIPFRLFKYQKTALQAYLKYRYTIYRKNRQCGVSTLTGGFALWYAMFFSHKKILIVSKRDDDAKEFLKKNVKTVYTYLPEEIKNIWGNPEPLMWNEHSVGFSNGSVIKSLTSSPDTMRSESASLFILDEAAFMMHMDEMWSGGQQTLVHGGNVIVISTTNGVGNWYHTTWDEAENGRNDFYPIRINWWDMDWEIKYRDEFTNKMRKISPVDNIRKCITKEDIEKWGPYYSPWLEEQWRQLQQRGEAHLFRQEVLAEFIGTGNTVLGRESLIHVDTTVNEDFKIVEPVDYVHPVTGQKFVLDFQNELRIWKLPVRPEPDVVENGRVIRPGATGHAYTMGVDISSGEADDFSSIVVIDCVTMEQVADLNIKVLPTMLTMMIDYIGRWYNGAFCVPERTGIGQPVCSSLYHDLAYSNIYRLKSPAGKPSKKLGFPTSPTYKPMINKALMDNIGEDGILINSRRIAEQLHIYVHLGHRRTGCVDGPGNRDDLAIATGLACVGINEAVISDPSTLIPTKLGESSEPHLNSINKMNEMIEKGGVNALLPVILGPMTTSQMMTPDEELQRFTAQLGGIPMQSKYGNPAFRNPMVTSRKNTLKMYKLPPRKN